MLIRKMRRDIVKNRVQFLAIFLMMFFGCFLYSGITGEWNGLWNHFDTFRSEQNLADEWAYRETFSEEELSKVKADPQIRQAEGRLCLPATVQGKTMPLSPVMQLNPMKFPVYMSLRGRV